MHIVCVESPFKPSQEDLGRYEGRYSEAELLRQNIIYARLAVLNSLARGETPFASHLLYTQVWTERAELRDAGIKAGSEMHHRSDTVALYTDLGVSSGMRKADAHAELLGVHRTRRIILDSLHRGQDPRDYLAKLPLPSFPYLEELQAAERGSERRIKTLA